MTTCRIVEGDTVMITGGGVHKAVDVKKNATLRLGRVGTVQLISLVGMRFGEVVQFEEKTKRFVVSNEHPDLDRTAISAAAEEEKDNRNLIDTFGANQQLSHADVMALKEERGVEGLLEQLVESSSTFASKTAFSQEKYIRKKKVKYALMFKVERVFPDNLAEMYIPTIAPSDQNPDEGARCIRLRCDTMALIVHHADIHSDSTVLCYEKTNGVLCSSLLCRLGDAGKVLQVMDKVSHPNTVVARMMNVSDVKQRWKAVPRNQPFLTGEDYDAAAVVGSGDVEGTGAAAPRPPSSSVAAPAPTEDGVPPPGNKEHQVSQWMRGKDAREGLLASPADSLIVVDDENPVQAVVDLLPLVALCGHIVVFSNFLENLTEIYRVIRNDCVHIQISDTWYRHQQVLSSRTHPTVNMSTAGGYLLTAIRVERNAAPRPRFSVITDEAFAKYNTGSSKLRTALKRGRDDE